MLPFALGVALAQVLHPFVLGPRLYTLLVIMAVLTTVATAPLLDVVKPDPWMGATPEANPRLRPDVGG